MATGFGSIKARRFRLTKLDACGTPAPGARASMVDSGFVRIGVSPQYTDGTTYQLKNAWDEFCINEEGEPELENIDLTIEFCKVNPDAFELTLGQRNILDGTTVVGGALGEGLITERFAIETWTKVPGACGATPQYVYWLFPHVKNARLQDFELANSVASFTIAATTDGAPSDTAWIAGATPATTGEPYPQSFLPANEEVLTGEHVAYALTEVAPPAETAGAVTLA